MRRWDASWGQYPKPRHPTNGPHLCQVFGVEVAVAEMLFFPSTSYACLDVCMCEDELVQSIKINNEELGLKKKLIYIPLIIRRPPWVLLLLTMMNLIFEPYGSTSGRFVGIITQNSRPILTVCVWVSVSIPLPPTSLSFLSLSGLCDVSEYRSIRWLSRKAKGLKMGTHFNALCVCLCMYHLFPRHSSAGDPKAFQISLWSCTNN